MQTFLAEHLVDIAFRLLQASGLQADMAGSVAHALVEADLLGHDTHGLALLPSVLGELEKGGMARSGEVVTLSERASIATWDGGRLPGPWLVEQAIAWARPRAQMYGSATVVIRRSHHIACLGAYLEACARSGLLILLASSDPAVASVAPAGGARAVLAANPIAAGIPTSGDPIIIDMSSAMTTTAASQRWARGGQSGPGQWWQDALGQPTSDPRVLFAQPAGALMPLGASEAGHKGTGLALMVEALTAGLAGFGRADAVEGWGATVWLQLYDPEAFAGLLPFQDQIDWLASAIRSSPPTDPSRLPRVHGQKALETKRKRLVEGFELHPAVVQGLNPWLARFGMPGFA
jgi:LDH2 family malate/lactate/ureidoglycolate dehydrogenase